MPPSTNPSPLRNKKETFSQNYRRLGLVTKLGKATGGVAPNPHDLLSDPEDDSDATSALPPRQHPKPRHAARPGALGLPAPAAPPAAREVRVERDAAGRIVRVLTDVADNPLGDALNALDSGSESSGGGGDDPRARQNRWEEEWGGILDGSGDEDGEAPARRRRRRRPAVIQELEREARRPVLKRPRTRSGREREWLEGLVAAHGEDVEAMARDERLNPMQQTAGDLARRIRKMRTVG